MAASSYDPTWLRLTISTSILSNLFYDGTYVWFTSYKSSGDFAHRLWRLRHSDKALIKPDGTVGDPTNAFSIFTNASGYTPALVGNGTNLVLTHGNGLMTNSGRVFRCSDMTDVLNIPSGGYVTSNARNGFLYGGMFYFPSSSGGTGIARINPTGWGVTVVYTSAQSLTSTHAYVVQYGDYAYLCSNTIGVEKVQISTWTRVWVQPSIAANGVTYDPIRDEVWLSTATAEALRIRGSDGAILNRTAAPDTLVNSVINSGTGDSKVVGGGNGVVCYGDSLFGADSAVGTRGIQRRSTSPTVVDGWGAKSGAHWYNIAQPARPQIAAGTTVYFSMSAAANIGWLETDTAPLVPNLTSVTPRAGKGLGLAFDNPVGMAGPTIGSPVDGIGVPTVTQSDDTHIDIDIDVPPVHPLGEAAESTPPSPPKGGGAFQL